MACDESGLLRHALLAPYDAVTYLRVYIQVTTPAADLTTMQRRWILFLASLLALYYELAIIRWIPGQVRILAYFTNFVLIACFFGIGVGLLLVRQQYDLRKLAPWAILGLVVLALLGKGWRVMATNDLLAFLAYEGPSGVTMSLYIALVLFYLAIAAAFVPLGQAMGRGFGDESPLVDYSVNLLGSMAGVAIFFLYSSFALPPWVWFMLAIPLLALLAGDDLRQRLHAISISLFVVALVYQSDRTTIWSPYQKLDITPMMLDTKSGNFMAHLIPGDSTVIELPPEVGFNLRVNDDFLQLPMKLTDEAVAKYPAFVAPRTMFDRPFQLKPKADRVLIIGAGAGNDVAAALRSGAKHIDAVEIDPSIAAIGRQRHPEQPYSDPRVRVVVDDARHFLQTAEPGYDLIIYAFLDSHRLMSTVSSLRLDSYVYTVESFQASRRLLKPDGVQVTSFAIATPWMMPRLYEMLRTAYGSEPVDLAGPNAGLVTLASGASGTIPGLPTQSKPVDSTVVQAIDDWPFIYADGRYVPKEYLIAITLVLLVSIIVIRTTTATTAPPNLHFFFLGVGFLLLETKNITTIALVFGSTWYVNSVVFFSILAMALFSNLVAAVVRIPIVAAYAGLFAAIGVNVFLPMDWLAGLDLTQRYLIASVVTASPIFFSGIIFAQSFRRAVDPVHALGSNILGGVCGGLVEYASMIFGLRFLFVLIAAAYLLSAIGLRSKQLKAT